MEINPRRIEVLDDMTASFLAAKSGPDRWDMACGMFVSMCQAILHGIRHRHPDWTEQQVHQELADRIRYCNEHHFAP